MPRKQRSNYKIKTHKATSKRFSLTGSGKLVRTKIGKGHLRRRTPQRTKYLLDRMVPVKGKSIAKRIRRMAPYMEKAD